MRRTTAAVDATCAVRAYEYTAVRETFDIVYCVLGASSGGYRTQHPPSVRGDARYYRHDDRIYYIKFKKKV